METRKLTFADTPELLFQFEQQFFPELKEMGVEGWNLWQISKVPLFYSLIRDATATNNNQGTRSKSKLKKAIPLIKNAIKSLSNISGKGKVILLTNTADKLSKNDKGIYYNSLVDPILDLGVIDKTLIIEQPSAAGFLMPACHPWHIDRQLLDYYAAFKRKFFKQHRTTDYNIVCNRLTSLLNTFLSAQNYMDQVKPQLVSDLASLFIRELDFFKAFFKRKKPPFVIGSECIGTGVMAAALELQMPFVELQHGSIDQYYPPYVWDRRFLEVEKVMKPTRLLVFGTIAKDIVLAHGFFKDEEVVPVGYRKIDDIRALAKRDETEILSNKVLVVVQPMMHKFNKELIKALLAMDLTGKEIVFKAHPLQPAEELTEYEVMMQGSNIKIVPKSENIHQLILKSDLVVGHVTTCLEEALSLGKPTFTVASEELPEGLHSMTGLTQLKDVIRVCSMAGLAKSIMAFYEDVDYRNTWNKLLMTKRHFVYNINYSQNMSNVIAALKSRQ